MKLIALFVCATVLAACASSGGQPAPVIPGTAADHDGVQARPGIVPVNRLIYVSNLGIFTGAPSVTAYEISAAGDAVPSIKISGPSTQLDFPEGIALAPNGTLYVANQVNRVTIYAPGASGDAAPVRTITCGGMDVVRSIAVDVHGTIYVTNQFNNSVSIFSQSDADCVTGNRRIYGPDTQLSEPMGVMVRSGIIYITNFGTGTVTEYPASAGGNVRPIATIGGPHTGLAQPWGIDQDGAHNVYVADPSADILFVYHPRSVGDVTPLRTIHGPDGGQTAAIDVAPNGVIYAANTEPEVLVYPKGSSVPAQVIQGPQTLLEFPEGIAIH